ncbi:MAG: translocation and assembly module TamB [Rhodothermales bacterium]|jgi:translocation and assembly module TamB
MAIPLKHISQRTAAALGAIVLVLVVVFFAATRTEIGRDAIARQLEVQFGKSTRGSLHIGRLTGNLVQSFTATDVRILGPSGHVLLAVDSILVSPSWEDLIRRRVDTRRVELKHPRFHFSEDSAGVSNWSGLLNPRIPPESRDSPWSFQSARLITTGGTITSASEDDPATAIVFGSDLAFDARLERSEDEYLVDLLSGSARLFPALWTGATHATELVLAEASAQAVVDSAGVTVNQAFLRSLGSEIRMSGTLPGTASEAFDIDLESSRVSFDELSALIPRLPLRGNGVLQVRASGFLDDFVVSTLRLSSGRSRIDLTGTVAGWPDSAAVDLQMAATPLFRRDLAALWPSLDIPKRLSLDSLNAQAFLAGSLAGSLPLAGELAVDLRAGGSAGMVTFVGNVAAGSAADSSGSAPRTGSALRVSGIAESTSLDLGRAFLTSAGSTDVNGQVAVDLTVDLADLGRLGARALTGTAAGTFRQSLIGQMRLGLVRFDGVFQKTVGSVDAIIVQTAGSASASVSWSGQAIAQYDVHVEARELELGELTGNPDLTTAINATVDASVTNLPELFGTASVAVGPSSLTRGSVTSSIPEQSLLVEMTPRDSVRVVDIGGSVATGQLILSRNPRIVVDAGRFWVKALADAARRETRKPYLGDQGLAADYDIDVSVLRAALIQSAGLRSVSIDGFVEVADLAALAAWSPGSGLDGGGTLSVSLLASAETISASLSLEAPVLRSGSSSLLAATGRLELASRFSAPVEDALRLAIDVRADSLTTTAAALPSPALRIRLADRTGRVSILADRGGRLGPIAFSAETVLMDDRTRLKIDTLALGARQLEWGLARSTVVDLYSDAFTVEGLRLTDISGTQSLAVDGTLSPAFGDTLSVVARALQLAEVTEFGNLNRQLGGLLTADIRFSGGPARPTATGSARVPALVLDGRLLGDVQLETSSPAGSNEISLALGIQPAVTLPVDSESVLEVIENRVRVAGTLRPPAALDPGEWNLSADIERGDLFFLKYVFNESADRFLGYTTGSGTVTGAFASPVVDAEVEIRDGAFGVPTVGTRYTLTGKAHIDKNAIHIDQARLVDHDGGSADVSGPLLFNDYRFFSFNLTGELNDLLIMNRSETDELPFYGVIRGTGEARLTGPLTNATLRIAAGQTRQDSELFIPIVDTIEQGDTSFIIFADSSGRIPDLERLIRRPSLLARRASAERKFLDGLDMDLNIEAPRGSVVHLVIDPLLGDVINAQSAGRVQIRRNQGEFEVFGQLEVLGGDYLFTAGEVFVRRFTIQDGGTLSWIGDPINARLDIQAAYRTRASTTGLEDIGVGGALIPLVVELDITGLVLSPQVLLGLSIDQSNQNALGDFQAIEARLNRPDRATEYATSVLLTNSFQLTTDNLGAGAGEQLAFNSVSQLVSSQLSRFLAGAIPNVDFNFGVQGERAEDLDITYGVALRLLDERLIIRGEGVYQGSSTDNTRANAQGIQGEFVVEVRLSPSVSAQVFFRREGDILQNADLTNTAGAGLTYQTDFPSWRQALRRIFGRTKAATHPSEPASDDVR